MDRQRVALVGRQRERRILESAADSHEAELIAVYGRRRVGKTFLVREHVDDDLWFELVGMHGTGLRDQLKSFANAMAPILTGVRPETPATWGEAFDVLKAAFERLPRRKRKRVIFFDEMPWLAGPRSGFLPAFEHFWNSWASKRRDLNVVVCGSAASWMLKELLHAKGGLHNRVTRSIRLEPFTLAETKEFLLARRIDLEHYQILELYMVLGGIPHYLKEIERGEAAAHCIDRVCFSKDGLLRDEFDRVYSSLFDDADRHERIIRALATRRSGLTRNELLGIAKLPTGGWTTDVLGELEASGFVAHLAQFGRTKKDCVYRVADEASLFHLHWIERHRGRAEGTWLRIRGTPAWRAWSGYGFEAICLKHVDALRRALGIAGVQTEESTWHHRSDDDEPDGAQIDLVIDRKDLCINLCEMKFSEAPFVIDRSYARALARKRETFRRVTKTRKTLFTSMVTTHGVARNKHWQAVVDASIEADALFR